jgi:uncharacterized surface protein with fasciclin (FAS1) repeats
MIVQVASAAVMTLATVVGTYALGDCSNASVKGSQCEKTEQVSLDDEPTAHSKRQTILDVAVNAGQFKTLTAAIEAAGFAESFRDGGPYTVFAPTDAAFAKLGDEKLSELLKPENREMLRSILRYHVVKGNVKAVDAVKAGKATTRQGGNVAFAIREGRLVVNQSTVLSTDIAASNGVIHVIDTVLLPS